MSVLKASLIGASLAVAVVCALLVMAVLGVAPFARRGAAPGEGPVVIAFVLPGADAVMAPKVVDVYAPDPNGWTIRSVNPSTPVAVTGTAGSTLADSYSFGGGPGLAAAAGSLTGREIRDWVNVDGSAWHDLYRSPTVPLRVPADIEVFDGAQLYPFAASDTSVAAGQLALVLQGAGFLPPDYARDIRQQIGDVLGSTLASSGAIAAPKVRSNLSETQLREWLARVSSARRVSGS